MNDPVIYLSVDQYARVKRLYDVAIKGKEGQSRMALT